MSIGSRLKEERERLGLSQTAFAALGGAKKRTQIDWESDLSSPTAKFLAAAAEHGLDVAYVVTGIRTIPATDVLPARERSLLANYRQTDEDGQRSIERSAMLEAQRKASPVETARKKRAA